MVFANMAEVHRAYENRAVELHAKVKVRIREIEVDEQKDRTEKTWMMDTTVGRAIFLKAVRDDIFLQTTRRLSFGVLAAQD